MRKHFTLAILLTYPAYAQVTSGTSIVFNFTKNKVIVAADSRAINDDGTPPDNSSCKIAALSHQFIFVSVGSAAYTGAPIDTVESWNNWELAGYAVRNVPKERDKYMESLATFWARAVGERWVSLCIANRSRCLKIAEENQGQVTSGIFVRAKDFSLSVASIVFKGAHLDNPVGYQIGNGIAECWPCGQEEGRICAAGSHVDVAAAFCSERVRQAKISTRTPLKTLDEEVTLPVKIVELTVDSYDKTVGDVGGKVDVAVIKNGSINWLQRKDNCPENQD